MHLFYTGSGAQIQTQTYTWQDQYCCMSCGVRGYYLVGSGDGDGEESYFCRSCGEFENFQPLLPTTREVLQDPQVRVSHYVEEKESGKERKKENPYIEFVNERINQLYSEINFNDAIFGSSPFLSLLSNGGRETFNGRSIPVPFLYSYSNVPAQFIGMPSWTTSDIPTPPRTVGEAPSRNYISRMARLVQEGINQLSGVFQND